MSNVDRTTTAALFLRKHMIYIRGRRANPKDAEPRLSAISHARDYIDMLRKQNAMMQGGGGGGPAGSPPGTGGGGGGSTTASHNHANNNNNAEDATGGTPPAALNIADALEQDLNFILYYSHALVPQPQPDLTELIQVFHKHMEVWDENPVSGSYILTALKWFVGKRRQTSSGVVVNDYHQRVAAMFLALRVLVPVQRFITTDNSNIDPMGRYFVRSPSLGLDWTRINPKEFLPNFVSIVSPQTHDDSAMELIYLSHNREMFEKPPEGKTPEELNSPFSAYPEKMRRPILGSVITLATGFMQHAGMKYEEDGDSCAIIKMDGVKMCVMQLTTTNCAPRMVSPESGKATKVHASTILIMGAPECLPDSYIRSSLRTILWTLEGVFGPRELWPANAKAVPGNPFKNDQGDNGNSHAFRWLCRLVGSKVMVMRDELLLRDDIPHNPRKVNHAMSIGTAPNTLEACGAPSWSSLTNMSRPSTHALTKRTCSHSTQLTLAVMQAADVFGGALAVVVLHNSNKVMSTAPPAVTSALATWCATTFHGDGGSKIFPPWMLTTRSILPAPFHDPIFSVLHSAAVTGNGPVPPVTNTRSSGAVGGKPADGDGTGGGSSRNFSTTHTPSMMSGTARFDSDASTATDASYTSTLGNAVYESTFFVNSVLAEQLNAVHAGVSRHTTTSSSKQLQKEDGPISDDDIVRSCNYPVVRLSSVGLHVVVLLRRDVKIDDDDEGSNVDTKGYNSDDNDNDAGSPVHESNTNGGGKTHGGDQQDGGDQQQHHGSPLSPHYANGSALYRHFVEEMDAVIARDMFILLQQLTRHDVILAVTNTNKAANANAAAAAAGANGGLVDGGGGGHGGFADPMAGVKGKKGTSKPSLLAGVPAVGAGGAVGRGPPSFAFTHDLYLGTGEFIDQSLGMASSTSGPQQGALSEANAFLREAATADAFLGAPLHPLAVQHRDSTTQVSFRALAEEPVTRVVLGRNVFSGIRGLAGTPAGTKSSATAADANISAEFYGGNSALFARRCGGQQSYFATADSNATAWSVEDMYTEYVTKLPARTTVI